MSISKKEASSFLLKASIGADYETIEYVSKIGKEKWLDEQINKNAKDSCENKVEGIWKHFIKKLSKQWGEETIIGNKLVLPYWFYFRMAYWDTILKSEDILRHRIALALSEILVISDKSVLELNSYGLANYYDLLYKNAFGNYEDLLYEVSVHPCMGVYLSHMNNPKEDIVNNIHPDENFAREVMQLFTIGLYELNLDGSKKLKNGKPIATYDNADIKEVAKVFTGLGPGGYWWPWENYSNQEVYWGIKENKIPNINLSIPMQAFEEHHDKSKKTILKKHKLKSNQSTLKDVKQTINILVKEQNTAVFISKKLIQSLVTSNPSKQYIEDISKIFIDNKKGQTGDLKAVVKAILLHKEANKAQKMKEPMLRCIQILKAFNASNKSGKLWGTGFMMEENIKQHPLSAPSVFNFFQNDYSPLGKIEKSKLVAPEFQTLNSASAISYVNLMYEWFFGHTYLLVSTQASDTTIEAPQLNWDKLRAKDKVSLDLKFLEKLATTNIEKLIDHLDLVLCANTLNSRTKEDIIQAIQEYKTRADWVVETALFMITISPDFTRISE